MAVKSKSRSNGTSYGSYAPWGFLLPDSEGIAPDSRVRCASDAYLICKQLKLDNGPREVKWSRIFRCYNLFPPNSYSMVAGKELFGSSNVPFGQMKYRVDNKKSPFFDMVMQRNQAANIVTKEGGPKEKKVWSDLISTGWDMILRRSHFYRYNTELTLQEMLLYGKGFEFADNLDGWPTTSYKNYEVLIPNDTYADLSNLGEIVIKRSYTPLEFWKKIKNRDIAEKAGWNFWACVNALRFYTSNYQYYKTLTEFLHALDSQSTLLNRVYNMKIHLYEMYVMEYDGSITKSIILQNYGPIIESINKDRKNGAKAVTEDEYMDKTGYLFVKQDYADKWSDLICPFMCSAGSGFWHEIKGFAEGIYTQCRSHDIHMNKLLQSLLINNTFMLTGGSSEATKKLKQMEWTLGGMTILPSDTQPVQNRWEMPVAETMQVMQYYTSEMDRGTGTYQSNDPTAGQRTLGQTQFDVAEQAKLQGTEVRGYNDSQSRWQNLLYKRMCSTTRGGEGYDLKDQFVEFMKENEVPDEAWDYDNLESLNSNLVGGAASPSFKAIAADKLIVFSGMTAANAGQEAAIQDAIAVYADRENVARYRPQKPLGIPRERREIGMENSALSDPNCNPENVIVLPEDNHLEHIKGHYSDAMGIAQRTIQGLQAGQVDAKKAQDAHSSLMFHGGHIMAHMQYLEKDPSKKNEVKQIGQTMQQLQKATDEVGSAANQMAQKQQSQEGADPKDDAKIQAQVAQDSIKVNTQQKLADIKLASKADTHRLAIDQKKEAGATNLAIKRAEAEQKIRQKTGEAVQDSVIKQNVAVQEQHINAMQAETPEPSEAPSESSLPTDSSLANIASNQAGALGVLQSDQGAQSSAAALPINAIEDNQ